MLLLTRGLRQAIVSAVFSLLVTLPIQSLSQEAPATPKLKDVIGETVQADANTKNSPEKITKPKKLVKIGADDEYDRGVPRNSIEGFFKSVKSDDFKRAAHYPDLRNLPRGYTREDSPELARQLKIILDRALSWINQLNAKKMCKLLIWSLIGMA
ncbi:hypothetical protein MNBD_GAMMA10-2123 [hydrothermal vent metagenome]|uniref:Uncharacterized protein n=1 Tax=hydrothermal vent metagenome TaxID=652676 RepID=A0A3B0XGC1_9ZZZZ